MTRGTYVPWEPGPYPASPTNQKSGFEYKTNVGHTIHGQSVELIATEMPNGQMVFSLKKNAVNQRDDTVTIFYLPTCVMDAIHEKVDMIKRLKN